MSSKEEGETVVNAMYADDAAKEETTTKTASEGQFVFEVNNLSYTPPKRLVKHALETLRRKISEYNLNWLAPSLRVINSSNFHDVALRKINFSALGGELTAIIGGSSDRHELVQLLSGRMDNGEFDGQVLLCGPGITQSSYYYDKMSFVQRKPLYIPGITYGEMLHYAVQLKLQPKEGVDMTAYVKERTNELLELMNLVGCKDRVIPTYPEMRGELGCDLRRLSIALEIVDLPPLIIVDEPTLTLDPAMSTLILNCLHNLASKGHIVVCSMSKPFFQEIAMMDKVVVLSEGHTIYANSPSKIQSYFCSSEMGYDYRKGTDLVEFVLDVASGIERPVTQRTADLPHIMQEKFEESDFNEALAADKDRACSAFSDEFFYLWGYGRFDHWRFAGKRIITVVKRGFYTKIKDWESIRQQFMACLLVGVVISYLQYQQGVYGKYCLAMLNFPYPNTTNITAMIFLVCIFPFALPWINGHVACQKLQVFRYEQKSNVCTAFAFILATLLSEIPATVFYILVFLNVSYFMVGFGTGVDNYFFFMITGCMTAVLGHICTYLFAAILKKEILLRDSFLLIVTAASLMSGFPFQIPHMSDFLSAMAGLNPSRWVFEALLTWKFNMYEDGETYLKTYGFQNFQHKQIFMILGNFLIFFGCLTVLALQKNPRLLKRKAAANGDQKNTSYRDSTASTGSDGDLPVAYLPRQGTRQSEAVKPVLFMRESSVTGRKSQLSVNLSQVGDENTERGPTVMFKDISYRVRDHSHPTGYKTVLNRVSGQFDWGKLSVIMGSAGSGKTTLLHVLAGDVAVGAELSGKILLNNRPVQENVPLWQRCGFVSAQGELFRDLTVEQVLTFAMKLRCLNYKGYSVVEENVKRTVEILHLEDVLHKKSKKLNSGELKRLLIAEEMVHGPKLLLVDEPTTDVGLVEASILMLCFREMVNQDRTVITTMHQPMAEIFKLFDSLMLLSKGRVIYHGPASGAATFFVTSPYQFNMAGYNNPADFLADISNMAIPANDGDVVDPSLLENYYMQGEFYNKLRLRFRPKNEDAIDTFDNPMVKYGGAKANDVEKGSITMSEHGLDDVASFDIGDDSAGDSVVPVKSVGAPMVLQRLVVFGKENCCIPSVDDVTNGFRLGGLIFYRNALSLINRYELVASSLFIHTLLGCIFGWVMGNCASLGAVYNVTSFFAIGSLFLIFTNVFFAFYMYNSHQVFLKEHARGLYSNFVKWLFSDYALYLLRMVNGLLYCLVVWGITSMDDAEDILGFSMLTYMIFMTTCCMLTECFLFTTSNLVSVYLSITALAFVNFIFSGLLIKFQTLPDWMKAWVPSLSVIRWQLQSNFINVYADRFPVLPTGFSPYSSFLALFGWGGKTKWFCLQSLVVLLCVYKALSFFTGGYAAVVRKGGRR